MITIINRYILAAGRTGVGLTLIRQVLALLSRPAHAAAPTWTLVAAFSPAHRVTVAVETVKMGTVMPKTTAAVPTVFRQFRNIIHPRSRRAWVLPRLRRRPSNRLMVRRDGKQMPSLHACPTSPSLSVLASRSRPLQRVSGTINRA